MPNDVDALIESAREAAVELLAEWRAPAPVPDSSKLLEQMESAERDLAGSEIELQKYVDATQPYRRLVSFVAETANRSADEITQDAADLRARLPAEVRPQFDPMLRSAVEYAALELANRIEMWIAKGDRESIVNAASKLGATHDPAFRELITRDTYSRFVESELRIRGYEQFNEEIRNRKLSAAEMVQKAQELGLSLMSPLVSPFVEKAVGESAEERKHIRGEFDDFRTQITGELTRVRDDIHQEKNALERVRGELKTDQQNFRNQLSGQFSDVDNELGAVRQRNESLERSVSRLRGLIIGGIFFLLVGMVALGAFIFIRTTSLSQQATNLETQIAAGATAIEDNLRERDLQAAGTEVRNTAVAYDAVRTVTAQAALNEAAQRALVQNAVNVALQTALPPTVETEAVVSAEVSNAANTEAVNESAISNAQTTDEAQAETSDQPTESAEAPTTVPTETEAPTETRVPTETIEASPTPLCMPRDLDSIPRTAQRTGIITANARVRSGAGTQCSVIEGIPPLTTVQIIEENETRSWFLIVVPGDTPIVGWVSEALVAEATATPEANG